MEEILKKYKLFGADALTKVEKYALVSKALVTAAELNVGGVLKPQQSDSLFSTVIAGTSLSRVRQVPFTSMSKDIRGLSISPKKSKNPRTDTANAVNNNPHEVGTTMILKLIQASTEMDDDVFQENIWMGDSQFENFIIGLVVESLQSDIELLAWIGTSDTGAYNADDDIRFPLLNKGYPQLIKEAIADATILAADKPIVYDTEDSALVSDRLEGVVKANKSKLITENHVIFLSRYDRISLEAENSKYYTNMKDKTDAGNDLFLGYELVECSIDDGVYVFTNPNDLLFGKGYKGTTNIVLKAVPENSQTNYYVNAYTDYGIARLQAITIGYDVTPA